MKKIKRKKKNTENRNIPRGDHCIWFVKYTITEFKKSKYDLTAERHSWRQNFFKAQNIFSFIIIPST